MTLSKYFKAVKIKEDVYAVYNSLVMNVVYVDKKKLDDIISFSVDGDEKKSLKNIGIYVKDSRVDNRALEQIKNRYKKVSGKLQIMYLIMSSSCNLACKYCFVENCQFNNKKEVNMSKDTALLALKKYDTYLRENNIKGSVIFYGGEPLVNWNTIKEVLLKAEELNSPINFSMVTNATLLNLDKIKFLAKHKVEVGISIDGPKELNDKNRVYRVSGKSVYDEVMKKFPMLKMEKCKFGLSITVSNDFLDHQDEVLSWLKKLNVKSIFYNLYHYTSYDDKWEEYYKRASSFLIKSYECLSSKNIYDGRLIRKIDSMLNEEFKFSDCGAIGGNQITVKPNGDLCVCHGYLKTDKYVIGNIKETSIKDVLNSDEMKFWKERNTLNNKKCLDCEALFICGGGCAIQAESLFMSRNQIDKPFCIHTKESLRWILIKGYDITVKKQRESKQKEVIG